MKLSVRETTTILAALRYWQAETNEDERQEFEHFGDDEATPLDDEEIDRLCERLNGD